MLEKIYKSNLTLLTDLYQLTMAYGYWKQGMSEKNACFNLYFRKHPFSGDYTVSAGLEYAIDFLNNFHFDKDDLSYLTSLSGNDGKALFDDAFISYLEKLEFSCDIDAIPEGRIVFPNEPLIRVKGPLIQCQLIETALLNIINFQTLIATKSSRICQAAQGEAVLEFGLRRAQGIDGALAASRAAYIGGGSATSNVLAGKLFGIPVKGTHAHSWVMSFDSELASFKNYAAAMPNNCVFLVDTYSTENGVDNAIEIAKEIDRQGYKFVGIRLDSGDLSELSKMARVKLDEAGFTNSAIVASNDLDEYRIQTLKDSGAQINIWGVGTRLVTSFDQPALGGVYKLAAIENADRWDYKIKFSEDSIKVSTPGLIKVKRFYKDGLFDYDLLYNEDEVIEGGEDLSEKIFANGKLIYKSPTLDEVKTTLKSDLQRFQKVSTPVRLSDRLSQIKDQLISEHKAKL